MIKMNKQFWKKIAVSLLVGVGVIVAIPSASAETGGGIGGGGSNGNLRGSVHWTSIAYDQKGKAYQDFLKFEQMTGRGQSWVEGQVVNRVKSNSVCQNSRVVWYLEHDRSGRWVYNYSRETHGDAWNNYTTNKQKSTIEKPSEVRGDRAPSQGEIDAFKNWDRKNNGYLINKAPGYVIICSGAFDEQVNKPPIKTSWPEEKSDSNVVTKTYTEPHSYKTDLVPQTVNFNEAGKLVDPIGKNNLNAQSTGASRTSYGVLIDSISKGQNNKNMDAIIKDIDAAIKKDKQNPKNATINLNNNNKAAMAEGGVLNVQEQTQLAKITLTRSDTTTYNRNCTSTQTWNSKLGKYNAPVVECSAWKKTETKGKPVVNKTLPTPRNTGFWQMLTVHCNAEGFSALTGSGNGIIKINQGSVVENIAAAANTKTYTQRPGIVDFAHNFNSKGEKNSNAARAATSQLGFYDKECPFNCTPNSATSKGASTSNGATDNTTTTGKRGNEKPGATSDGLNNNSFDFFRDNKQKNIKVDVWYPANGAGVHYDGHAPKTTTVTRWSEGTPGTTNANGGKFTMKTASGETLFNGKDKNPTNQRNWDTSTFSSQNSTSLPGLHNEFTVQSTWASEKDRPQQMNVKYEYAPTVDTSFYGRGVGFETKSGKSVQRLGSVDTVATAIDGKCYVNYSNGDSVDTTKAFHDNTGSGTSNNLDGKLLEGPGNSQQKTNLIVRFVRATAE